MLVKLLHIMMVRDSVKGPGQVNKSQWRCTNDRLNKLMLTRLQTGHIEL